MVRDFDIGKETLGRGRGWFAVGLFFCKPELEQIAGSLAGTLDTEAVRGQSQRRNMRVIKARWKIAVGDFFKQDTVVHNACKEVNEGRTKGNAGLLKVGLIELTTLESTRAGQRHVGLPIGAVAIRTWPGAPTDPATQHSGARWIMAVSWFPYQKKTFVTPACPGYISDHSTFSRAGAEVLAAITGSPFFPGGIGTFTAPAGKFLTFEYGPSQTVQLQWGTYFDAADQAGLSRLWGGIHVSADDLTGRRVGAQCGLGAWAQARQYFDGSVMNHPVSLTIRPSSDELCEIRYTTLRGFYYKLQSSASLDEPFADDPSGVMQATDTWISQFDSGGARGKFYRVSKTLER